MPAEKETLVAVYPSSGRWTIVAMEVTGLEWGAWKRYRLLRLALRLDAGLARVHEDEDGRLLVVGHRCKLLEAALRDSPYTVDAVREARHGLQGFLRPRSSWQTLFQKQFYGAIPRRGMLLPLPWKAWARRRLRESNPEAAQQAMCSYALPLRWRLLRRRMKRMDSYVARVHVVGGVVEVENRRGAWRRDSLLEAAILAWSDPGNFIYVCRDSPDSWVPWGGQGERDDDVPPPGSVQLLPVARSWRVAHQLWSKGRPWWLRWRTMPEVQRLVDVLDSGEVELWRGPGGELWACVPGSRCWSVDGRRKAMLGERGGRLDWEGGT